VQFNSYSYLVILAPLVLLFWGLPARFRHTYLLILSLLFYTSWTWIYAPLPLLVCSGAFLCARQIIKKPESARRMMWVGVGFVLSVLAFFKYRGFVVENLGWMLRPLGMSPRILTVSLALPLGISFYSFEAISYLIDTQQGRLKQTRFRDLSLFVTFFPHLIAGPIVRVRELIPQFAFNKTFNNAMLLRGLDRLLLGLVQKNLIANNLAAWVDEGFMPGAVSGNTTIDNWALAIAFGLQIYFDFASYSNMAIGTAQLFGIALPENFKFPYHAVSPADFWNRWHMTLSRWIRDYLFFPINAKYQSALVPLVLSLVGIMALVGLWHGAGWGFVIWGLMHGCYLAAYRLWEIIGERRFPRFLKSRLAVGLWRIFTLLAVTAAWIPFRASSLKQAVSMLRSLVVPHGLRPSYQVNFYLITLLVIVYTLLEPLLAKWFERLDKHIPEALRLALWRPAVYACALLLFLIFDDRNTQFIYFQF
jgi:alginate O-acetyltransferase complex protein AlgI